MSARIARDFVRRGEDSGEHSHQSCEPLNTKLDRVLEVAVIGCERLYVEADGRLVSRAESRSPWVFEESGESFAPVLHVRCAAAGLPRESIPDESRQPRNHEYRK